MFFCCWLLGLFCPCRFRVVILTHVHVYLYALQRFNVVRAAIFRWVVLLLLYIFNYYRNFIILNAHAVNQFTTWMMFTLSLSWNVQYVVQWKYERNIQSWQKKRGSENKKKRKKSLKRRVKKEEDVEVSFDNTQIEIQWHW